MSMCSDQFLSHELLNALSEAKNIAIAAVDMTGTYRYFSKGAENLLGYTAEELVGNQTPIALHDRQEIIQYAEELSKRLGRTIPPSQEVFVVAAEEVGIFERQFTFTKKDGSKIQVIKSTYPLRDPNGKLFGFVGIAVDISTCMHQQEEFARFVSNLPVTFFRFTQDETGNMHIQYVSKFIEKILGYLPQELLGKPHFALLSVFSSDFSHRLQSAIESLNVGDRVSYEGWATDKLGEKQFLRVRIQKDQPLDSQKWHIDGLIIILTKERLAQEALDSEKMKSVQAAKLATVGQMSAGLSHEINNPLAVIVGKTDRLRKMAQKITDLNPDFFRDLDRITEAATRIQKIVDGVKKMSRSAEGESPELYSLSRLITEAFEYVEGRAKRLGIELRWCENPSNQYFLKIKTQQVHQAVLNIFINAMDAIENLPARWIAVQIEEKDDIIELRITDSGPGIPKEVVDRMMEPFFTTKEVGKGTGLGLSICKGIIEDQGGRFYYNQKSPNTEFILHFPKKEGASLIPLNIDDAIEAHSAWKQRLLIYAKNPDRSLQPSQVSDDTLCRLGKWILQQGQRFGNYDEFRSLKIAHRDFHISAGSIVAKLNTNTPECINALLDQESDYGRKSLAIVEKLLSLKYKIENENTKAS